MQTDKFGQVNLNTNDLMNLLMQGKEIDGIPVIRDEDIELFELHQSALLRHQVKFQPTTDDTLTIEEYHNTTSNEWLFPVEYQSIDVHQWLLNKCETQGEIDRVNEEYIMYEDRDLLMVLRLFIYIIDHFRKNGIVWGVGRGSSVSSFCLYLIGTHFVNSLKYDLQISDFLR